MIEPHLFIFAFQNDVYKYTQHRATGGSWSISTTVVKVCHRHSLGCAILKKNHISIFLWIFSITIIRRYFAECVIVLISDYCGQLQFLIFFIFCVLSSHQ